MKCDGVLFDLDGTLWDATVPIAKSWATALEGEPGVDHAPTVQELEGVMGMTAEDLTADPVPQRSVWSGGWSCSTSAARRSAST